MTAAGCPDGAGTQVGGSKSLSSGSATSDATSNTDAVGKYCWRAEYSGDGFYSPSSHTNDTTECFTTVGPSISVDKSANPTSIQEPGGNVTFTVVVKNTSEFDPITITSLSDDVYGNLDTKGTCSVPQDLDPGDSYTCQFTGAVSGTGEDEGENSVEAQDSATVTITSAPPAVHNPLINLNVTKNDLPDPVALNGQLTYTIVVGNKGPDAATQVTAADALPAGTSFVSVATTQGTCANNGGLIQCSLGVVAKGATVTITLIVTATQSGTITNTVTVVGHEPESDTSDNTATATTLVPTPLTPPTPKPKPKPKPVVCDTFTVTPKGLSADGKTKTVVVRVTNGGKPVKGATVVVKGAGVLKKGKTNRNGVARITIKPKKAGILVVTVPQKLVCGAKRIGVVGVFEPPVTG